MSEIDPDLPEDEFPAAALRFGWRITEAQASEGAALVRDLNLAGHELTDSFTS